MTTVTELVRSNSTTNSNNIAASVTTTVAAGRTVVAFIGSPTGASVATSMSVADTKGNTWTVEETVFDGTYAIATATCVLSTGYVSGDTITATQNINSSNKTLLILDLGVIGNVDVSGKFADDGATHASPTVSTSSAATDDNEFVIACFFNSNTTHTFTAGSGYTLLPSSPNSSSTGTTTRQQWVEYRDYTTGAGSVRTASGTYATAASYAAVILAIKTTLPPPVWAPIEVGRTLSTVSSTTKTVTLTQSVPAGNVVLMVGGVNYGGGTATTSVAVTSTGNTWFTRQFQPDANYAPFVASCTVGTAMSSGATVTVTVDHALSNWKLVMLDLGPAGGHDVSGSVASGASSGSPSVTTSPRNATVDHQYVIAAFNNTNTTHAFTPGGGYTAIAGGVLTNGTGASANNLYVCYQEYNASSGSPRVAAGTFATSGVFAAVIEAVNADVSASNTHFITVGGVYVAASRYVKSGSSWV